MRIYLTPARKTAKNPTDDTEHPTQHDAEQKLKVG